ncbi:hypothetical protein ES703_13935 [subsurface metagenome]
MELEAGDIFKKILRGKVVIVGIGNALRGDDGLGSILVERLKGKVEAVCIDAGNALENYLGSIVKEKPDTLLLIDAAHLDRLPGEYQIIDPGDLIRSGFSTHDISAGMLIELLSRQIKGNIYLLGVQPEEVDFGEKLSARIESTLCILEKAIVEAVNCADRLYYLEKDGVKG